MKSVLSWMGRLMKLSYLWVNIFKSGKKNHWGFCWNWLRQNQKLKIKDFMKLSSSRCNRYQRYTISFKTTNLSISSLYRHWGVLSHPELPTFVNMFCVGGEQWVRCKCFELAKPGRTFTIQRQDKVQFGTYWPQHREQKSRPLKLISGTRTWALLRLGWWINEYTCSVGEKMLRVLGSRCAVTVKRLRRRWCQEIKLIYTDHHHH